MGGLKFMQRLMDKTRRESGGSTSAKDMDRWWRPWWIGTLTCVQARLRRVIRHARHAGSQVAGFKGGCPCGGEGEGEG